MKFALVLAALSAAVATQTVFASTLTTTLCSYTTADEGFSANSAFKVDGVEIVLFSEEGNPFQQVRWTPEGQAELYYAPTNRSLPLGKGTPYQFGMTSECKEVSVELPSSQFAVKASSWRGLPYPTFLGDHNGYTGPALARTTHSKLVLTVKGTREKFVMKSHTTRFKYEGEWHDE